MSSFETKHRTSCDVLRIGTRRRRPHTAVTSRSIGHPYNDRGWRRCPRSNDVQGLNGGSGADSREARELDGLLAEPHPDQVLGTRKAGPTSLLEETNTGVYYSKRMAAAAASV